MPEPQQPTSKSFHQHARLIGGLTLISRMMGLVRQVVAGHFLGTGLIASAFTVAFQIPNLFRKLLGEGALSQAFIPLYAQAMQRGSTEGGETPERFAAGSVKLLAGLLIGLTLIGEAILIGWIEVTNGVDRPDRLLMLKFAAVMLPYVLCVCGGAFLSAILQVHKRFGAPAFAPVVLNVVHIAVVLGGAAFLGLHGRDPLSPHVIDLQKRLAFMLAVAVLVAGVLQVMVLLPALRAIHFDFRLRAPAWTPDTKKMLRMSLPVAIGAGVLQISVILDKTISYSLMQGQDPQTDALVTHFNFAGRSVRFPMEVGAPSRLDNAQLLYQFPLGVFAIALATAIFPSMSAGAVEKDREMFKRVTREGVLATLWEGLPASVGLMLVADPCVRLLFQHGQITAHDATLIARSTMVYSAGIWAYSMLQVINRAYYAIHDTITPLIASVINIVANLAVEIPLLWWLGEPAMAVGTVVSFSLQAVIMLWMLDRRVDGMGLRQLLGPTLKILLATAVMTAVLLTIQHTAIFRQPPSRWTWAGQLAGLSLVGSGVYLLLCRLLRVRAFGR